MPTKQYYRDVYLTMPAVFNLPKEVKNGTALHFSARVNKMPWWKRLNPFRKELLINRYIPRDGEWHMMEYRFGLDAELVEVKVDGVGVGL